MPVVRMLTVDGGGVAEGLLADAAAAAEVVERVVHSQGDDLLHRIKRNANTGVHGPREGHIPGTGPGPNVVTGDYVASWHLDFEGTGGAAVAVVWTDAPQAPRLEYGFHGVDSLGRRYDQPAFPHIEPAAVEVEERTVAAFEAAVDLLTKGVVSR